MPDRYRDIDGIRFNVHDKGETPPRFAHDVHVSSGSIDIFGADIHIGAVEIKDHDSPIRLDVETVASKNALYDRSEDGAHVAIGAIGDAIVAPGAVGTVSAKLRRITQALADLETELALKADLTETQPVHVSSGSLDIFGVDLHIGAVEIKDHDSDIRLDVETVTSKNALFDQSEDGAHVAIGATDDALVAAGAVGTVSAKLRRMTQALADLETELALKADLGETQPTSLADGADVTSGSIDDAIVAAGAVGTISAKLRRVTQALADLETELALKADLDETQPTSLADGADVTSGSISDDMVAAGAVGTISAKLRRMTQGLADLQTELALKADLDETQPVSVTSGSIDLIVSDLQIGAVEVKDHDSDIRLDVETVTGKNAAYTRSEDGAHVAIGATDDALVAAGAVGTLSAKLRRMTQGLADLEAELALKADLTETQPTSLADGADVTSGSISDAMVAAGAVGTVSAKLRRVTQALDDIETDIESVVTQLTSGSSALAKAEGAAHAAGDVGVMVLGIRHDNVETPTAADGEYTPININEDGILRTQAQQHLHIDTMAAVTGWTALNTDTVNLATTANHIVGTLALEFDKVDGAANTVFGAIQKTVASMDMAPYEKGNGFFLWTIYLSNLDEVDYAFLRLGTDVDNYNEWRIDVDELAVGWNSLRMSMFAPAAYAGNGWNSAAVVYAVVGAAFDAQNDELADIAVDHLSVNSGLLTSADITAEVSSSVSSPNINLLKIGGKVVDRDAGVTGAGTQRVVLPTDQSAIPVTVSSGSIDVTNVVPVDATGQGDVPITLDGETVDISDRAARDVGKVDIADIDGFASVKGQKTMAESFPTVLASDQSAIPVTISSGSLVSSGSMAIADGDDVTQGAIADDMVAAGAVGTVSAKLRRISSDLDAVKTAVEIIDNAIAGTEMQTDIVTQPAAEQTTPTFYNLTLVGADTEYCQALPANTRALQFQCRTAYDVRYAFETGKVAGPASPYSTLKSGMVWYKENIKTSGSLYLASSEAGVVTEIESWA